MILSMTGFSKAEASIGGINASVEIRSVNGRYLEINCRMPKQLNHKEQELRELIRQKLSRGNISVSINLDSEMVFLPLQLNEAAATECYKKLNSLKSKLKLKEEVTMGHLLQFSSYFISREEDDNTEAVWKVVRKAMIESTNQLDRMRRKEGQHIAKDLKKRMSQIGEVVSEIELLGLQRIPEERDKIRQRIAQLFESDEIDEQRLQMEMVLLADKLDISEECVRLNSHIKFFFESLKSDEPSGRKINFLLQEMHREVNTIGSKANDAYISQQVVKLKEEIERIREQVQNIE